MAKPGRIHEGNAFNRDFILMLIPLYLMAFFFYGPRVILLALVAMVTARICDRASALLRGRRYDRTENSSLTISLIIVLLMPPVVHFRVIVMAVIAAVMVGKEAFGGAGSYPFNPSAVGFCVAAVSWPDEVMRYVAPTNWAMQTQLPFEQLISLWRFENAVLVDGPSAILRAGGLPKTDIWNLLLGNYAGALGATCNLVILSCVVYLLVKKRISIFATGTFLVTVALIAFLFPRYTDITSLWWQDFMLWRRLQVVKYELLSGAMVFASVFMVNDAGTIPKNRISQIIYGFLLGFASMMFRYFGTYEMGICFAFLLVNAVSGYFDRAIASFSAKRKGAAVQHEG